MSITFLPLLEPHTLHSLTKEQLIEIVQHQQKRNAQIVASTTSECVKQVLLKCEKLNEKLEELRNAVQKFEGSKQNDALFEMRQFYTSYVHNKNSLLEEGQNVLDRIKHHLLQDPQNEKLKKRQDRVIRKILMLENRFPILDAKLRTVEVQANFLERLNTQKIELNRFQQILAKDFEKNPDELSEKKESYQKTYNRFIAELKPFKEEYEKLATELKEKEEIAKNQRKIILLSDPTLQKKIRLASQKIFDQAGKEYKACHTLLTEEWERVKTYVNETLRDQINRIMNGIDWKTFQYRSWKFSMKFTEYVKKEL